MKNLILSAFAVLAFGSVASAIRCYSCRFSDPPTPGLGDQTCKGPNPDASHLLDCPWTDHCSTVVSTASASGDTFTAVIRTCGDPVFSGCEEMGIANVCTYTCDTDGCNSDSGSGPDPTNEPVTTTSGSCKLNLNFLVMMLTLFAAFQFSNL